MRERLSNWETYVAIAELILSNCIGGGLQMTGWINVPAGIAIMGIGTIAAISLIIYAWIRHKPTDTLMQASIAQSRQQHWHDLANIAQEMVTELPLSLTTDDYPDGAIDRLGKEINLISFGNSDVKWQGNPQGQIELQIEHKSSPLFNGLIAHLNFEFPDFKRHFDNWRNECTWHVGWNRPKHEYNVSDDPFQVDPKRLREYKTHYEQLQDETSYLIDILGRVADRRTFKGTCKICKDM